MSDLPAASERPAGDRLSDEKVADLVGYDDIDADLAALAREVRDWRALFALPTDEDQ